MEDEEGYMSLKPRPRKEASTHSLQGQRTEGSSPPCTQWHRVALGVASVVIFVLIGAVTTLANWVLQTKGTLNGTKCLPDSEFRQQLKYFACNSPGNSTEEDVKTCKICPQDWKLQRESCYWISEQTGAWAKGQEDCRAKSSMLVVLQNPEEMMFIKNFTHVWLGLTAKKYESWIWEWVDGSPAKDELFSVSGPAEENSCVVKMADAFYSEDCDTPHRWICEKTAFQV